MMLHLPYGVLGRNLPGKPHQYFIVPLWLSLHFVSHWEHDPEFHTVSLSLEQNSAAPF